MRAGRCFTKCSEKNRNLARVLLSFTAGMIVASFLPYGAVMFLLCLSLIIFGVSLLFSN